MYKNKSTVERQLDSLSISTRLIKTLLERWSYLITALSFSVFPNSHRCTNCLAFLVIFVVHIQNAIIKANCTTSGFRKTWQAVQTLQNYATTPLIDRFGISRKLFESKSVKGRIWPNPSTNNCSQIKQKPRAPEILGTRENAHKHTCLQKSYRNININSRTMRGKGY